MLLREGDILKTGIKFYLKSQNSDFRFDSILTLDKSTCALGVKQAEIHYHQVLISNERNTNIRHHLLKCNNFLGKTEEFLFMKHYKKQTPNDDFVN